MKAPLGAVLQAASMGGQEDGTCAQQGDVIMRGTCRTLPR